MARRFSVIRQQWLMVILCMVLGSLVGCGRDTTNYLPLEANNQWEYHLSGPAVEDVSQRQTTFMAVVTDVEANGAGTITRYTPDGHVAFERNTFKETDDGLLWTGMEAIVSDHGNESRQRFLLEPPRPLIKYPIEDNVNHPWSWSGKVLVASTVAVNAETTTTVSRIDQMNVPAGEFADVVEVTTTSAYEEGETTVTFTISRWYAPNIGLIKQSLSVPNHGRTQEALRYVLTDYELSGRH